MIRIVATFHVRPEAVEDFRTTAAALVSASRAEEGNVSYDLCVAREDPCSFAIIEAWRDEEAVAVHNAAEHFISLVPRLVALSSQEPSVIQYAEVQKAGREAPDLSRRR